MRVVGGLEALPEAEAERAVVDGAADLEQPVGATPRCLRSPINEPESTLLDPHPQSAAVRKQAPVVAENLLRALDGQALRAVYDGYGSCPLTVERGKIVLAEFGYGGKILPTFPFLDGRKPSRLAWFLKEKMLPTIYWQLMLRGP